MNKPVQIIGTSNMESSDKADLQKEFLKVIEKYGYNLATLATHCVNVKTLLNLVEHGTLDERTRAIVADKLRVDFNYFVQVIQHLAEFSEDQIMGALRTVERITESKTEELVARITESDGALETTAAEAAAAITKASQA